MRQGGETPMKTNLIFSNGGGWGARLEYIYGATANIAANAGASLTKIKDRTRIIDQLHDNKDAKFDIVVLQGGFNDAMGENIKGSAYDNAEVAPYGTISLGKDGNFDTTTFAGALEELFFYAKKYFSDSQICYIITYQTPCSQYGGRTADVAAMRLQWEIAKAACKKWGIAYLDLFDGTFERGETCTALLDSVNPESAFFPLNGDNVHLNKMGYDVVSP